jgi:DivIVA domain-containing protein
MSTLRPEDITSHDLPLAMRGYDKERVDRLLARIAEAYTVTWQQSQVLRERLRSLEAELAAAEGEARASAKSVAELMQRSPAAKNQPPQSREARDVLEVRLERSEREREQALADLRQVSERASALDKRLEELEGEQRKRTQPVAEAVQPAVADGEAAKLLVAATRAAEDVRDASRQRALHTLTRARDLSALVQAQTERERAALAEIQQRRNEIQREVDEILAGVRAEADREVAQRRSEIQGEADEILAGARAEADHTVAAIEAERLRMRDVLTGVLTSLDAEAVSPPDGIMADLESRLHETAEPTVT